MKKFVKKINSIDENRLVLYLNKHKDKSIQEVYDFIKSKKLKYRSLEENLVYTYMFTNRKKLELK